MARVADLAPEARVVRIGNRVADLVDPAAPEIVRLGDGLYGQAVDRSAGMPKHLDTTAHEGRTVPCGCRTLLEQLLVVRRFPLRILGTRQACTDESHAQRPWLTGVFKGLELRLSRCLYCGAVEVRDVSLDILPGITSGRGGPRRRNVVLGWYSGSRPSGRTYL